MASGYAHHQHLAADSAHERGACGYGTDGINELSNSWSKANKDTPSTSATASEFGDEVAREPSIEHSDALFTAHIKPRLADIELVAVARFLSFWEIAAVALAGREVGDLLTVPVPSSEGACGGSSSSRQLIVPVVEVKLHTMDIMTRASAKHMEVLRVWSRGAFEEVKRVIEEEGKNAFCALEKFSAKGCSVSQFDVGALAPLIAGSRKLSLVNFEKNQFRDNVVTSALVNAFAESSFDTLNLRFNMVSDGTAEAVADVVRNQHPTLSTVNFKMNRITDVGAIHLALALRQNRIVRVLNLRRQHPGLTDKSAKAFAAALADNDSLTRLLLRRNHVTDEGCCLLADAVASRFARLKQSFSADHPRFELDLEDNKIGVKGALALVECLRRVGPTADIEILLHGNIAVQRDTLRQALCDAGEDPCAADDQRLRIESSKAEHLL